MLNEVDQIIREHFDLSDAYTRKYISLLEDAEKDKLLDALSSALYDKIVNKVDDIDFGTIPSSRGDITKVQGFDKTEECIDIIRKLVIEYKQSPEIVDVVIEAINNIKERKAVFIKSFALQSEFPMLMYNLIVVSIERSVSLMIATCIQFTKDPSSSSPKMALDKVAYTRTIDDVLYKQLITFNKICKDGSFDKMVNQILKTPIKEDVDQYENGVVAPIDEEEPNMMNDHIDSSDLFDNNTPVASPSIAVQQPTVQQNDFPEVHFDNNDRPIAAQNDDDEEIDIEITDDDYNNEDEVDADSEIIMADPAEEAPNDEVEYDNIPVVNPTDDINNSNTAISEYEATNEGVGDTLKNIGNLSKPAKLIAGAVGIGLVVLKGKDIIKFIVGGLRNLIYGCYYTKMKISDYLQVQAELIEANANELEISTNSGLDDKAKDKVVKKQRDWANKLRKWSDKFNIDSKKTAKDTEKAIEEDDKDKNKVGKDDDGDDVLF